MFKNACRTLVAAAVLLVGAAGCTDLTTVPSDALTGDNIFNDPASYRAFLAKLYTGLAVTGQQGPAGQPDVESIDEGFGQYVRGLWQLQTLPTDEAVIGWADGNLPRLNTMEWDAHNEFVRAFYYRVFFQITLANEFLRETTEAKLTERGASDALRAEVRQYRAEARFLRALSYWHGIDVFGDIPLLTDAEPLGVRPSQSTRAAIFAFIEEELRAVMGDLPGIGQAQYGRADRGAAHVLLAKLLMNAEVYGAGNRYADAMTEVQAVIQSNRYQLAPQYMRNFLADNHTSPEIIFPVPFDGNRTRTWGGTTFLVNAALGGSMLSTDYGTGEKWGGLRVTQQLVSLFPGGAGGPDRRSHVFYTDGQTLNVLTIPEFTHGYAAPKYRNITSTGAQGSHSTHPDTDYPMFRLADAYLMYAELHLRGGGGSIDEAVAYVNAIRERAYGNDSGNITAADLTLAFVLAERARELFWEGHRRTDLIRYGLLTTGSYLWAFKGSAGAPGGQATSDCYNIYPLPAAELVANPNLNQHACYGS
jgi:starch-binding outer membrane protein, SusD/RagB family